MTTVELLSEECIEDWNAQQLLQAISDEVRSLAPEGCCMHGDPFCLSCGLNWAVEQNVPLRLGN